MSTVVVVIIIVVAVVLGLALAVRIVKQYEQGVLFRLGRVVGTRDPGLRMIIPVIDNLRRVSLRIAVSVTNRKRCWLAFPSRMKQSLKSLGESGVGR